MFAVNVNRDMYTWYHIILESGEYIRECGEGFRLIPRQLAWSFEKQNDLTPSQTPPKTGLTTFANTFTGFENKMV